MSEKTIQNSPYVANWRQQIAINERKTKFVIGAFIGIYIFIGFLLDVYLHPELNQYSLTQIALMFFNLQVIPYGSIVFGLIAVFSLIITYAFHDRLIMLGTNYHEISADTAQTTQEKQLYNIIEELKLASGMRYMPKIFIIQADYMNAFASGYSEKSALVAITTGLLEKLDREEIQAVMAHELSHIRHHDIKLTLMATVLTNIMLIALDFLFYSILFGGNNHKNQNNEKNDNRLLMVVIILRYILPLLTVILLFYLSRSREYMADAGAVELTRNNKPLATALIKISKDHINNKKDYANAYNLTSHENIRQRAYFFDPTEVGIKFKDSVATMFSTHPSITQRLKALGFVVKK